MRFLERVWGNLPHSPIPPRPCVIEREFSVREQLTRNVSSGGEGSGEGNYKLRQKSGSGSQNISSLHFHHHLVQLNMSNIRRWERWAFKSKKFFCLTIFLFIEP